MRHLPLACLIVLLTAAPAHAATYTWTGGSGNWGEASHWAKSGGLPPLPGANDDVVIGGTTTLTVTLNSEYGLYGGGANVRSLTLGGSAGTQEVLIKTDAGTQYGSALRMSAPSTIGPRGQITLSQDPSTGPGLNKPELNIGADLTNQGTILSRLVTAPVNGGPYVWGAGVLNNTGTLRVQSGQFDAKVINNTGTIQVDAGASLFPTDVTMSAGTIVNGGTLTSDGEQWKQRGGAVTGNPIRIASGGLDSSGGAGTFLLRFGRLSGTIGAGQTVLLGERAGWYADLRIPAAGVTIANGGTVIYQSEPFNGAALQEGPVIVGAGGTLRVAMPRAAGAGSNDRGYITGGLRVEPGGLLDVGPDSRLVLTPQGTPRPTWVNAGTLSIAPGGEVYSSLSSDDVFTNTGALNLGIASPARFGRIYGGGTFAPGGTIAGVLADGYAPAAGSAFKVIEMKVAPGAFAGGPVAYASDSVSLVYGASAPAPAPAPVPVKDTTAPALTAVKPTKKSVSFTSSEAGKAKVTITRTATGRKVKGRCVAQKAANRKKPSCKRTVTVATRTKAVVTGSNQVALPKLAKGRYGVTVVVTDAAGNAKTVKTTLKVK